MNQSKTNERGWFNKKDRNFFFGLNELKSYRPINDYYYNFGCFHSNSNQGSIFLNASSNVGMYGNSIIYKNGGQEFEIENIGINEKYLFFGISRFSVKELEVY